jgi:hypothetical protein
VSAGHPDASHPGVRSALLRLSTRIAESQDEEQICQGVAEGLMHQVFGFDGVGIYLAGSETFEPALKASAGRFGGDRADVSQLRLPLRVDQSALDAEALLAEVRAVVGAR